jgi:hypothetical protein
MSSRSLCRWFYAATAAIVPSGGPPGCARCNPRRNGLGRGEISEPIEADPAADPDVIDAEVPERIRLVQLGVR